MAWVTILTMFTCDGMSYYTYDVYLWWHKLLYLRRLPVMAWVTILTTFTCDGMSYYTNDVYLWWHELLYLRRLPVMAWDTILTTFTCDGMRYYTYDVYLWWHELLYLRRLPVMAWVTILTTFTCDGMSYYTYDVYPLISPVLRLSFPGTGNCQRPTVYVPSCMWRHYFSWLNPVDRACDIVQVTSLFWLIEPGRPYMWHRASDVIILADWPRSTVHWPSCKWRHYLANSISLGL